MYTIKKLEGNSYEIKIQINEKEWEEYLNMSYEENKQKFNIQGFRKGKAPKRVIEQNYGEHVFDDDALEIGFNKQYIEALESNKDIEPIDHPEVKVDKFEKGNIELTAIVAVMPEVKLGAYTGLDIETIKETLSDEKVEKELNQVRDRQARFVEAKEGELSKSGDFVTIDFVGSVDGVEFEGGKAENYRLEIGSHSFIEGFEDQVIGMKVGAVKDINVTFPENYQAENLKGKPAVFKITLHKIEQKELPELDDEFASNVSDFETLEDYKQDIKKHLQESLDSKLKRENENKLIEAVVKNAEVDVPKILVEKQLDMFIKDLENRLMYQNITLDQYCTYLSTTKENLREERRSQSVETVKTRLVLEDIIKKENLFVSEEELSAKLEEIAAKYKKTVEEYKKSLGSQNLAYFENDILMDKLIKFLTKSNNLK